MWFSIWKPEQQFLGLTCGGNGKYVLDPFSPLCWGVGPPRNRTTDGPSVRDLGNLEARSTPLPPCSTGYSWGVFVVGHSAFTYWGATASGCCCHVGDLLCPQTCLDGWQTPPKWHPHKCQDPRNLSRTWHCNETISVTYITCQLF